MGGERGRGTEAVGMVWSGEGLGAGEWGIRAHEPGPASAQRPSGGLLPHRRRGCSHQLSKLAAHLGQRVAGLTAMFSEWCAMRQPK